MTLDEAVAEFERGFAVVRDGEPSATAWRGPNAAIYAVVTGGGVQWPTDLDAWSDSYPRRCYSGSPGLAAQLWLWQAQAFAKDKGDVLLWRVKPELTTHDVAINVIDESRRGRMKMGVIDMFGVYSRFVVVPAAELPKDLAA